MQSSYSLRLEDYRFMYMHICQPRIRRPRRLALILRTAATESCEGGTNFWGASWGAFRVALALLAACTAA